MSVIHNDLLLATDEATGYNLTKSLRFRSGASAYLARTPASATNRQTWTWSGWVKRGKIGSYQTLFSAGTSSSTELTFHTSTDSYGLDFGIYSGGYVGRKLTSSLYRDTAAWYHVVAVMDTTNATAGNRMRLYVNGVQLTAFSVSTDPSQNTNTDINNTVAHNIGNNASTAQYFDGYITEVNFIDGQALTPSSFGETDAITGVWKPKAFSGTYGTNGFYLPFTDVATTSGSNAGLGKDFSSNGNYWNTNNISVTTGATYDSMTDVPTLTSATTANYAVLNPLNSTATISYANLQWNSNGNLGSASSIAPNSGKWYAEFTFSAINSGVVTFGVSNLLTSSAFSGATQTWQLGYSSAGKLENAGSQTTVATYTTSDVVAVAFDCSTGAATFYKNNTSVGTITNAAFANVPVVLGIGAGGGISGTSTGYANFGQQPFTYTPPTGYVALNTYNLPDSTIVAGNTVMDATLYIGNGTTNVITNAGGFKPDFVWVKARSSGGAGYNNIVFDSVRGASKSLSTDLTAAEYTGTDLTSFNSNGFTAAAPNQWFGVNTNGVSQVGWQWQAGQGTTSSNTSGSITSTVSVNANAGFSVVTYTGAGGGVAKTFGHGLGVAPNLIIIKDRQAGVTGTDNWVVYHSSLGATGFVSLNSTNAFTTSSAYWNNTAPTSSVVTVGGNSSNVSNESGIGYVAYCWSEIAGFSKFGSYTGNGNADGTFVYTGFKPKFVMFKRTDSAGDWNIRDTSRSPYNVVGEALYPNLSFAEYSGTETYVDLVSNGFKFRGNWASDNASGATYIYVAFAENPQKLALAR